MSELQKMKLLRTCDLQPEFANSLPVFPAKTLSAKYCSKGYVVAITAKNISAEPFTPASIGDIPISIFL